MVRLSPVQTILLLLASFGGAGVSALGERGKPKEAWERFPSWIVARAEVAAGRDEPRTPAPGPVTLGGDHLPDKTSTWFCEFISLSIVALAVDI